MTLNAANAHLIRLKFLNTRDEALNSTRQNGDVVDVIDCEITFFVALHELTESSLLKRLGNRTKTRTVQRGFLETVLACTEFLYLLDTLIFIEIFNIHLFALV